MKGTETTNPHVADAEPIQCNVMICAVHEPDVPEWFQLVGFTADGKHAIGLDGKLTETEARKWIADALGYKRSTHTRRYTHAQNEALAAKIVYLREKALPAPYKLAWTVDVREENA